MERAHVHGGTVEAERGEERFHDNRRARDDEPADDRQLAGIGITAPDGETSTDHADGAEDEPDEHDDAHCFARAFSETAGGLSEDGSELVCETSSDFIRRLFYRSEATTLLQRRSDLRSCALGIARRMNSTSPQPDHSNSSANWKLTSRKDPRTRSRHSRVVSVLHRGELGLATPNRPRGSFLLLGPTGVGKTELTIEFTRYLFGKDQALPIRYVRVPDARHLGLLLGGVLAKSACLALAVAESATGTLLFDEIEKAHPRVLDLLLQILDAARVTMASGETLDFSNFYVVLTSNLGAAEILNLQHSSFATMERHVLAKAQQSLRPELFARITEKLVFNRLSYDVQLEIARAILARELDRLRGRGFVIGIEEGVIPFLVQHGFHPRLGARPMRDAVEKFIRDACARQLLNGSILKAGRLSVRGNQLELAASL